MAEMPKGQQCKNCRYAGEVADDSHFICQRYPPIRLLSDDLTAFWPRVEIEEWCGEWAPANPQTVEEGAATMARLVLLGDLTAARALADKLRE